MLSGFLYKMKWGGNAGFQEKSLEINLNWNYLLYFKLKCILKEISCSCVPNQNLLPVELLLEGTGQLLNVHMDIGDR